MSKFTGELGEYDVILTEDGTQTIHSQFFNESAHSRQGAALETKQNYIDGCQVLEEAKNHSPVKIFEIGFGIGIGFLETLKHLKTPFLFVSSELDKALIEFAKINNPILHDLKFREDHFYLKKENFELIILYGDARVTLPAFLNNNPTKFHAIYQDPFSPKKMPKFWTVEWFELLKSCAHEDARLSTYSSSSSIRKSLLTAGWKLHPGKSFGRKKTATIATLKGESDPAILDHLARSPVMTVYDANIEEYLKS